MGGNNKVSIVIGGMNRAGAETFIMNFLQSQSVSTDHIDLVVFGNGPWDYFEDITDVGAGLVEISQTGLRRLLRLYQYLKENKVGIVHSHVLWYSGLVLLIAYLAGVKGRIAHSHNTSDSGKKNKMVHSVYRFLMKYLVRVFSSDRMACGKDAGLYMFGKMSFEIVPNGISARKFTPYVKSYSSESNLVKIVSVGRLEDVKNHQFIIEVLAILRRPFLFEIYGRGSQYNFLESQIESLDMGSKIKLMGSSSNIDKVFRDADILVMPSKHEGFPVTLIEAQFSNLPCLVSNNITNEVDLGYNLVKFLPLDIDLWARELETYEPIKELRISVEDTIASRFSSNYSAGLVLNTYMKYV